MEEARRERIARNMAILKDLGLKQTVAELKSESQRRGSEAKRSYSKSSRRSARPSESQRSSQRLQGKPAPNYCESTDCVSLGRARYCDVDEAVIEEARQRARTLDSAASEFSQSPSVGPHAPRRSGHDSGRGVRIQGGKIYDSRFGVTCHWCRQKTLTANVTCTRPNCGNGRLPVTFCRSCLLNRHGEDCDAARASGCWVCPACRGSCGRGCASCCNCGPCRKRLGLIPTGQVKKQALDDGFNNVHDWLIFRVTGESAEEIAARKHAHKWGAFMASQPTAQPASQADQGCSQNLPPLPTGRGARPSCAGNAKKRGRAASGLDSPELQPRRKLRSSTRLSGGSTGTSSDTCTLDSLRRGAAATRGGELTADQPLLVAGLSSQGETGGEKDGRDAGQDTTEAAFSAFLTKLNGGIAARGAVHAVG